MFGFVLCKTKTKPSVYRGMSYVLGSKGTRSLVDLLFGMQKVTGSPLSHIARNRGHYVRTGLNIVGAIFIDIQ